MAKDPIGCPGSGWLSYTDTSGNYWPMTCFGATVQNCPNDHDLNLTFGYLNPSGIISGKVNGLIVFFDGGDGTMPAGDSGDMAIDRQILATIFSRVMRLCKWPGAQPGRQPRFFPPGDLRPMETSRTLPAAQPHF
jgi:hypothetical protein